jgi:hypothetical protein
MGFLRDKSKSTSSSKQDSQNTSVQGSTNSSSNYASNSSIQDSMQSSQGRSVSDNQAYPWLQQMLGGTVGRGDQASQAYSNMLGLNGQFDQNGAFDNFLNNSGYKFNVQQGSDALAGNAASKGLLGSGSFGKGIQAFGQNTGKSYLNDYMSQLFGQSGQGIGAAGTIAGAGGRSVSDNSSLGTSTGRTTGLSYGNSLGSSFGNSQGTSSGVSDGMSQQTQGLGGLIGSLAGSAAVAFSDSRLKTGITKIGRLMNGLSVYAWTYLWGEKNIGVMADEVKVLRPDALGPLIDGKYMTVNYSRLMGKA